MIITKKHIAEQVRRRLSNMDIARDEQIDNRDIYLRADQVTNELSRLHMLPNMVKDVDNMFANEFFIVTMTLPVTDDEKGSYATFPGKYNAIEMVTPENNPRNQFIPIKQRDLAIYGNNHALRLEGKVGFYVDGRTIRFRCTDLALDTPNVMVRAAIADSSSLDDDAPYPIPPFLEKTLIDEIVVFFIEPQIPEDEVNDSSNVRQ
jgi:hypothetical protein